MKLIPVLLLFQLLGQSAQKIRSGPSVSARASSIVEKEVFALIFCILPCLYAFSLHKLLMVLNMFFVPANKAMLTFSPSKYSRLFCPSFMETCHVWFLQMIEWKSSSVFSTLRLYYIRKLSLLGKPKRGKYKIQSSEQSMYSRYTKDKNKM